MTIVNVSFAGEVDVFPRIVRVLTKGNLASVAAAGFLSGQQELGQVFYPNDLFAVAASDGSQFFNVASVTAGVYTLAAITTG